MAKEFVGARSDLRGVLVLSPFTGAAVELTDAVLANPYATDAFADALHAALTMPKEEQGRRLRRMREVVAEHSVYRWAGALLGEAVKLASMAHSYA